MMINPSVIVLLLIVAVSSLQVNGYPGGFGRYTSLGCWRDNRQRALQTRVGDVSSVGQCVRKCQQKNCRYAAVEYGKQCFCGSSSYKIYGRSNNCNMRCMNQVQYCGGFWAMNVYLTVSFGYSDDWSFGNSDDWGYPGIGQIGYPGIGQIGYPGIGQIGYPDLGQIINPGYGNGYIGCYGSLIEQRSLRRNFRVSSLSECSGYCRDNGCRYSGLTMNSRCSCGNEYGSLLTNDQCNVGCQGSNYDCELNAYSIYNV